MTAHDCLCDGWTPASEQVREQASASRGGGTLAKSIGAETARSLDAPRNPLLTLKSAISAVVESHDMAN